MGHGFVFFRGSMVEKLRLCERLRERLHERLGRGSSAAEEEAPLF